MPPFTITSSGLVTHFEVADFGSDPFARKVTRDAAIIRKLVVGWQKSKQRGLHRLTLGKGALARKWRA